MVLFGLFSWYNFWLVVWKKNYFKINKKQSKQFHLNLFDDYITYVIISLIIGGRLGYVLFYNFNYFISNPIEILFIWNGGMSFHGGLLGIIIATDDFFKKHEFDKLVLLDVVSCVAPVGIFFGRLANFVNGELYGKPTDLPWAVVFPMVDSR